MVCTTDVTRPVVYVSGGFPVKNPQAFNDPWQAEFRRYISQSGSMMYASSGVACTAVAAKDAQSAGKSKAEALRKDGKQVIETGWTYAGG
jgi:hypothetical protein